MNTRKFLRSAATVPRILLTALFCAAFALPSAQAVDFSGKQIEVIVPSREGGGNDVYARAIGPFLQKHLPGNPRVLIRNLPGAGSITGANHFQAHAKPDGLMIISVTSSTVSNFAFRDQRVKFELDKWEPIVLSPQGSIIYASTALGVEKPEDLLKLRERDDLVYGGRTATSADFRVIVSLDLLGFDPKTVWGIERGAARLAFERGEFNINYDTAPGYLANAIRLVEEGKAAPLFTLGIQDLNGDFVRDPNFPDLPSFVEVYETVHGKKPEGAAFEAWKALFQIGVMANKSLFLPTGTPQEIVESYRTTVNRMLEDPEFREKAASVIEGYPQFIGEQARPIMSEATTMSEEAWNWLADWVKKKHDVTL